MAATRRELKFENLNEAIEDIKTLSSQGYDQVGNWNLAMICQHLSKTMRMTVEGADFKMPGIMQWVARLFFKKTFMTGKPVKMKVSAPAQLVPEETEEVEKWTTEFTFLANKILDDNTELVHQHPVFGKLSTEELRKLHGWHAAHHLSFLLPK